MEFSRYQRQSQLPMIGTAGQEKLAAARVLIVGCGALGAMVADQLARAGIGYLRLVDRDLVEKTNLQRQILYSEGDIDSPKAEAAARRLSAINSTIEIEALVTEANDETINDLTEHINLIMDGTDNFETRYLLNNASIEKHIPWIYGGCIATEGRCMVIRPGITPCLQCLFPNMDNETRLPTCDSAGILATAAAVAGSLQTTAALQLLTGNVQQIARGVTTFDLWTGRWRTFAADATPHPDCPACGNRSVRIRSGDPPHAARILCGRNAVQFPPVNTTPPDFRTIAFKWKEKGSVNESAQMIRLQPASEQAIQLALFRDGRVIIHGCKDIEQARFLYDRYLA